MISLALECSPVCWINMKLFYNLQIDLNNLYVPNLEVSYQVQTQVQELGIWINKFLVIEEKTLTTHLCICMDGINKDMLPSWTRDQKESPLVLRHIKPSIWLTQQIKINYMTRKEAQQYWILHQFGNEHYRIQELCRVQEKSSRRIGFAKDNKIIEVYLPSHSRSKRKVVQLFKYFFLQSVRLFL